MNDVEGARADLESAERELAEVRERHAAELASAARAAREAQAALDTVHRATLATAAEAWAAAADTLTEQAAAAGDATEQITGTVLHLDNSRSPFVELVFTRDLLAGRAAEAQAKAERLREFSRGGLRSDDLARIVDERGQLPERELMAVS